MSLPTVNHDNNIWQMTFDHCVKNAFAYPGLVPTYIGPLFCLGKGPFR